MQGDQIAASSSMADYMEAVARKINAKPPASYGYKVDMELRAGFFVEQRNSVNVLEKPICIPSGRSSTQGYMVFFAYCQKEGVASILSGQMPPMLPATLKDPASFESMAEIAANFGAKDPQAAAGNSSHCVAFRVPPELATQAETPGRDIWLIRFDNDAVSPLLEACNTGNAEKVSKILSAAANARVEGKTDAVQGDVVDEHGVSGLMMAAMAGSLETCKALLVHNAQPNAVEPFGNRTALMFAAQGGHTAVVQLLLGNSADVSKVDSEGQTALMWAAVAGKADTARILAASGFKDVKNQEGLTALQIAEKLGHQEVILCLK